MNQVSQGEGAGRTGQRTAGAVEGLILLMGTVVVPELSALHMLDSAPVQVLVPCWA